MGEQTSGTRDLTRWRVRTKYGYLAGVGIGRSAATTRNRLAGSVLCRQHAEKWGTTLRQVGGVKVVVFERFRGMASCPLCKK